MNPGIAVNRPRGMRGFSLLELLIVVSMGLVIAALAVPNMISAAANMRLRSAAGSISGVIQNSRKQAIRQNRRVGLVLATQNGAQILCADVDQDGVCDPTEGVVQIPNTVTRLTTAPTGAGAPTTLNATVGIASPQMASLPSFNPRGLPCLFASGACTTNTGFVIYLTDTRAIGANGWAAVSVTPSGRVKTWLWTGGAWGS